MAQATNASRPLLYAIHVFPISKKKKYKKI